MERFSPYEYLGFVIPGGLVCVVAFYGAHGWPYDEPGATYLVAVLAAAFVAGHLIAGLSNYFGALVWGHAPWNDPTSHDGAFDRGQYLHGKKPEEVQAVFRERVGNHHTDLNSAYKAAVKLMHAEGRAKRLDVFNQQIGFYRGTATACLLSLMLVIVYEVADSAPGHLPVAVWAPVFALATAVFARRYRRFWRLYGREVWLDVSTPTTKPPGDGPEHGGTCG